MDETKLTDPAGEETREAPQQQIMDMGSSVVSNRRGTVQCLTIVGQIEGHMLLPGSSKTTKYEHVLPLLAAIEASDEVDGLLVLLNTVGGDIEVGLAIAELIAGMRTPAVTLVLGGGHSIGIPLAVSGKVTIIVPSTSMTIHPVRMSSTVIAVPAIYRYFDRIQKRIIDFVARNSWIVADRFRELMLATGEMDNDVGSIVYGEQAVELGLMDRIGTLSDALEALYNIIEEKRNGS